MLSREWYVVDTIIKDARDGSAICNAVFDQLGLSVETARVDAYSDYDNQMPEDIRAAELWLRDRGLGHHEGDPAMGVLVSRTDEIGWAIVQAYAPWSTHLTLLAANDLVVATFEDAANLVTVLLARTEFDQLRAVLEPATTLISHDEWMRQPGRLKV